MTASAFQMCCLPFWINTWHATHRKVKKWHKVTQIYGTCVRAAFIHHSRGPWPSCNTKYAPTKCYSIFTVWKKQTNVTEYTYVCQISTEKQTTNSRICRSPILAHLAYSWHTLGSLWAHLARMAHLAHSSLTHGSLGSHGSLLAHSADLADLTDLAHSCLILGSLGSLLAHLGSLGSLLALPWLILGSPLAHLSHSWLTLLTLLTWLTWLT